MVNTHCLSLRGLILAHKGFETVVVDTYYEVLVNENYSASDIIHILSSTLGVNVRADVQLKHWINYESRRIKSAQKL